MIMTLTQTMDKQVHTVETIILNNQITINDYIHILILKPCSNNTKREDNHIVILF